MKLDFLFPFSLLSHIAGEVIGFPHIGTLLALVFLLIYFVSTGEKP